LNNKNFQKIVNKYFYYIYIHKILKINKKFLIRLRDLFKI